MAITKNCSHKRQKELGKFYSTGVRIIKGNEPKRPEGGEHYLRGKLLGQSVTQNHFSLKKINWLFIILLEGRLLLRISAHTWSQKSAIA
jgi:hypothetical protein